MALLSPLLASERHQHKLRLLAHRRGRSLALGPRMWLQFEDELTVQHQLEQLQATPGRDTQREVETCAHLLPSGTDWKATVRVEHRAPPNGEPLSPWVPDAANEAVKRLYVELPCHPRVQAQPNKGLPDSQTTAQSQVHFLCFNFPGPLRVALLAGASATLGCAHDQYAFRRLIPLATLERLRCDLATRRAR